MTLWAGLQGVVQTRKLTRTAPDRMDSTRVARGLVSALLIGWGAEAKMTEEIVQLVQEYKLSALSVSELDLFE